MTNGGKNDLPIDPEELDRNVLRDMRNGSLSPRTKEIMWNMIELTASKSNFRGYDEDTLGEMKLTAFEYMVRYWKNYSPYMIKGFKNGETVVSKKFTKENAKNVLFLLKDEKIDSYVFEKNSSFSYFSMYVYNAFKHVINRKKKGLDGFSYRTGEYGGSINGHVVVPHDRKDMKYENSGAIRDVVETEATRSESFPYMPKASVEYYERPESYTDDCGEVYEIIYDRNEAISIALKNSDGEDEFFETISYLSENGGYAAEIRKDDVLAFHALRYLSE